jgi:two-component system response regulator HydG
MVESRGRTAPSLTLPDFHTEDAAMAACLKRAQAAAITDLPVLILGESGTGKTLLARAIHNSSSRAAGPFVSFNSAALSDTLLDSQLFGHERGAFTGAHQGLKGKFELADTGSLFIDEIADLSPVAQAKILRAVEYGEFERLGSEAVRIADVRLISATHYPLPQLTESERFRKDLFFRISGIVITIPPLRERPNDLRVLIAAEIGRASRCQHKRIAGLHPLAADWLFAHRWSGNLRELSRVVETAVALTETDIIQPESVLADTQTHAASVNGALERVDEQIPTLAEVERRHVLDVLQRCGGNKRRAARLLDVSRSTFDRKLRAARSEALRSEPPVASVRAAPRNHATPI